MRLVGRILAAIGGTSIWVCIVLFAPSAYALDSQPSPTLYYGPLYITAFESSDGLDMVELHNDTNTPVDTTDWKLVAGDEYGAICEITLGDYVLPDSYVTLAKTGLIIDSTGNIRTYDNCVQSGRVMTTVQLFDAETLQETIMSFAPGAYVRKGTTKTYRTGLFTKDFEAMDASTRTTVYADPWYQIPADNPLQITEIVAHANECSPLETMPGCSDYIKFYNPTTQPIDLSLYRLRSGYQGQSATSSNTWLLTGILEPGHFGLMQTEADGSVISLTNSGGWVWFEDSQGLKRYDQTVAAYPDAGSTTKSGWAWAYDDVAGAWSWTMQPTPYDQPSVFVLPTEEVATTNSSDLKPCASNQYRSPDTNRCRLISSSSSTLQPCASNQYRSPETNRCRNLTSTSSSLAACSPGQVRNPLTNRCKSAATTTSSLKPCAANQTRNPETNRCRKTGASIMPVADFPVKQVKESAKGVLGWWAFGGVGVLALGYAGWEWRYEAASLLRRAGQFFTATK